MRSGYDGFALEKPREDLLITTSTGQAVRARAYRENMTNNVLSSRQSAAGGGGDWLGTWACDSSKDAGSDASMVSQTHSFTEVPESLGLLVINHFTVLELA